MNSHRLPMGASTYAVIAVALLAVGGVGAVVAHRLGVESGQAHAYVTLGKEALAKGNRASATLSFERAGLLAPRADFVRSALADSDLSTVGAPVARAVGFVAPREWSSLTVAFGWLAGVSLAMAIGLGRRLNRTGHVARRVALCSGVAFVLTMAGAVESSFASRALAVVMAPTGALVSPYQSAGASADLHPGDAVVVGERYGDFVEVHGTAGVRGWVPSGTIESVVGAGA
jgi:hypothetical protein